MSLLSGKVEEVFEHKLPSVLDIKVINDEYEKINSALNDHSKIILDASETAKITTPGIQLLISLSNFCVVSKLELTLVNPSLVFEEAFTTIGIGFSELFQINRRS
jgi:anti-anti-sigma regulatory factor